jgi:intracellular septation protein
VSTDVWVSFKAFGFLPLTFLFAFSQVPLMQRYSEPAEQAGESGGREQGTASSEDR